MIFFEIREIIKYTYIAEEEANFHCCGFSFFVLNYIRISEMKRLRNLSWGPRVFRRVHYIWYIQPAPYSRQQLTSTISPLKMTKTSTSYPLPRSFSIPLHDKYNWFRVHQSYFPPLSQYYSSFSELRVSPIYLVVFADTFL